MLRCERSNRCFLGVQYFIRGSVMALGAVVLIAAAASPVFGQWSSGSGFFINGEGILVTNYHVVSSGCSELLVRSMTNDPEKARIIGTRPESDLALLEADVDYEGMAFIRMKEGYQESKPPIKDEHVTTLGFPKEGVGPQGAGARGGFVSESEDPKLGKRGFTIDMLTEAGASGSPVLDVHGLVVGVVWGANEGGEVNVYAISNRELADFLLEQKVRHGTSTIEDWPYKREKEENFFDETERVLTIGFSMIARVYCNQKE